jgi:SAM-dependent methyltransferase
VLEIGAGEGALAARLARRYDYLGLEPDRRSFLTAEERLGELGSGKVLNAAVEELPAGALFDLVCGFEVLEHIEDDRGALRSWREHVRPGGWMMLSVPAWRSRWGSSDVRVGHYRRYDRDDMEALLTDAGLTDRELYVYGFPLGYLLQTGWKLLSRRTAPQTHAERSASSGRWLQPPAALGWMTQIGTAPFRVMQRPFLRTNLGTGLVCVARLPHRDGDT